MKKVLSLIIALITAIACLSMSCLSAYAKWIPYGSDYYLYDSNNESVPLGLLYGDHNKTAYAFCVDPVDFRGNDFPEREVEKLIITPYLGSIEMFSFSNMTNLRKIEFQGAKVEIGVSAFACCTKLKKVDLSDGIKVIHSCAFQNCESLETVILPENIEKIISGEEDYYESAIGEDGEEAGSAFMGCKSLKSFYVLRKGKIELDLEKNSKSVKPEDDIYYVFGAIPNEPTIYCYRDSYIHRQCDKYGNKYHLIEKPSRVKKLKAYKVGKHSVKLSWKGNRKNTNSYLIQKYISSKKKWKTIAKTKKQSYTVKKLKAGRGYCFRIRPVNLLETGNKRGTATKPITVYTSK